MLAGRKAQEPMASEGSPLWLGRGVRASLSGQDPGLHISTRLMAAHGGKRVSRYVRTSWLEETGDRAWLCGSLCCLTLPSPRISVSSLKHGAPEGFGPLCLSVQVFLEWLCTQAFSPWQALLWPLNLHLLCQHPSWSQTVFPTTCWMRPPQFHKQVIFIMSRIQFTSPLAGFLSAPTSWCPHPLQAETSAVPNFASQIHTYDTSPDAAHGASCSPTSPLPLYSLHLPEMLSLPPSSLQTDVTLWSFVAPFIWAPPWCYMFIAPWLDVLLTEDRSFICLHPRHLGHWLMCTENKAGSLKKLN